MTFRRYLSPIRGAGFAACLTAGGLLIATAVPVRAQAGADMEPLPIKLPKPAFQGTPKDIPAGSNAEKPSGKPRPIPTAPRGTINLALHKKVTSSKAPFSGTLDLITDGDKEARDDSAVEIRPG